MFNLSRLIQTPQSALKSALVLSLALHVCLLLLWAPSTAKSLKKVKEDIVVIKLNEPPASSARSIAAWIKILPAAALNAIKKRHINRMRVLLRSNMVQILYPNSGFVVLDILEHSRM